MPMVQGDPDCVGKQQLNQQENAEQKFKNEKVLPSPHERRKPSYF